MTEFHCTILGNPGDASVNKWKDPVVRRGKNGRVHAGATEGKRYRAWKERASIKFRRVRGNGFGDGPLQVAIVAYWPRKHRKGPAEELPLGDVDAVAKAVLDALEDAGVIANDAQVVRLGLAKAYSKKSPRIEVKVKAC